MLTQANGAWINWYRSYHEALSLHFLHYGPKLVPSTCPLPTRGMTASSTSPLPYPVSLLSSQKSKYQYRGLLVGQLTINPLTWQSKAVLLFIVTSTYDQMFIVITSTYMIKCSFFNCSLSPISEAAESNGKENNRCGLDLIWLPPDFKRLLKHLVSSQATSAHQWYRRWVQQK